MVITRDLLHMGDGENEPVETRVGIALSDADTTIAVAESCTGGLVGSFLTDVSGSSEYFDRALVTYSNGAKQDLLAVSRESLDQYGAVSEPVAREMAKGVRDTAGTTYGLSTTGIAGPGGGTDDKPVGTIYVGVAAAGPWGSQTSTSTVERYQFEGSRTDRKEQFARQALRDLLSAVGDRE
jgi:nicotinamide-nucleotide amidase